MESMTIACMSCGLPVDDRKAAVAQWGGRTTLNLSSGRTEIKALRFTYEADIGDLRASPSGMWHPNCYSTEFGDSSLEAMIRKATIRHRPSSESS